MNSTEKLRKWFADDRKMMSDIAKAYKQITEWDKTSFLSEDSRRTVILAIDALMYNRRLQRIFRKFTVKANKLKGVRKV